MQKNESEVKRNELRTIALLTNVSLCSLAMRRAMELVCLYGPAGYGKSMAAAYTANALDAYYIECKEVWSKAGYLERVSAAQVGGARRAPASGTGWQETAALMRPECERAANL